MRRGNAWVKYFWLAIILYMTFTAGRLAYRNYQLNLEEAKLEHDIAVLETEIQDLNNKIIYYQSDSYKEKMLRAKLNLQKTGEKVVVITPEPKAEQVDEKPKDNRTNPERWWDYFFPAKS
jgi:cell division protein FtsB